jgi:hypothetical protein
MRQSLFALALILGTLAIAPRAQAANYPWCALYDKGGGETSCSFSTFEQCLEDVHGIGGFCQANNTYVPPTAAPAPRRARHKSAKNS